MADPGNKDGLANILKVAITMCLVCSVVVSTAAVLLKPQQEINKELDRKQNILRAAGLLPQDSNRAADGRSVQQLFADFTIRAVDLDSGEYTDAVDVATFEPIRSARVPALSRELRVDQDIAVIGRRENVSLVYVLESDAGIEKQIGRASCRERV